jgi:hypothetical protein
VGYIERPRDVEREAGKRRKTDLDAADIIYTPSLPL